MAPDAVVDDHRRHQQQRGSEADGAGADEDRDAIEPVGGGQDAEEEEEDGPAAASGPADEEMTDAEAMMLYRQIEAERESVVGGVGLAAARNVSRSDPGGGAGPAADGGASDSERVAALTHVMLDRERLSSLDDELLSCLGRCTHLHLQRNRLRDVSFMPRIGPADADADARGPGRANGVQFALLSHNEIGSLAGLEACEQLVFLDVSHNRLRDIDPRHLPRSLRFFNIKGNPCTDDAGTRRSGPVRGRAPRGGAGTHRAAPRPDPTRRQTACTRSSAASRCSRSSTGTTSATRCAGGRTRSSGSSTIPPTPARRRPRRPGRRSRVPTRGAMAMRAPERPRRAPTAPAARRGA